MNDKNNQKEAWWKPAVTISVNISSWIAFPIIIALILGKYLDKKYNSSPWFFIGLSIIAFMVSMIAIWKILMEYLKKEEQSQKNKQNDIK